MIGWRKVPLILVRNYAFMIRVNSYQWLASEVYRRELVVLGSWEATAGGTLALIRLTSGYGVFILPEVCG